MRLLAIGDAHIPQRAKDIPTEIKDKIIELTQTQLFDYTFFTGDVVKAPNLLEFLNLRTKRDLFIVIGNMDYFDGNRDAPLYRNLTISLSNNENLNIGLTHGAQVSPRGDHTQLELIATEKNYKILISGHTHHEEVFLTQNGTLLLNPGSVTGAWSFVASEIPSFIIIEIDEKDNSVIITLYQKDKKTRIIDDIKSYFIFKNNIIQNKY